MATRVLEMAMVLPKTLVHQTIGDVPTIRDRRIPPAEVLLIMRAPPAAMAPLAMVAIQEMVGIRATTGIRVTTGIRATAGVALTNRCL
jgi:hypothetical protein